jgi:hypothetical protein
MATEVHCANCRRLVGYADSEGQFTDYVNGTPSDFGGVICTCGSHVQVVVTDFGTTQEDTGKTELTVKNQIFSDTCTHLARACRDYQKTLRQIADLGGEQGAMAQETLDSVNRDLEIDS